MTYSKTLIAILALAMAPLSASCSESETEQRERLNRIADEVAQLESTEDIQARLRELSGEDLAVFSGIMDERMAAAQGDLAGGSELTNSLIEYAEIDSARADRLVAQCELELGVSAIGEEARQVAQCVDDKW